MSLLPVITLYRSRLFLHRRSGAKTRRAPVVSLYSRRTARGKSCSGRGDTGQCTFRA